MVAGYVSPDHGWLESPNKTKTDRVIFKAGKAREGYFTSEDILKQASTAMDICAKHYPDDDHVFVYDNATTHLKRADNALSARHMPKFPPKFGYEWDGSNWGGGKHVMNWGVETPMVDPSGKVVHETDGAVKKVKVQMQDAKLSDGSRQCLHYPEGHTPARVFKGMAVILEERGYNDAKHIRASCAKFQCLKGAVNCCCRRMLYNQPDFVEVKSLLEVACEARGFRVLFIPKFHCELNFIKQCWGYSKRLYRLCPVSSREANLEHNIL